ncbi:MAG: helix-turn-helix transcriptional regulator [Blastocatellia bacterium]|nr:helix-turn-helix transcriptional regulator [Blastocatellia bacterium]
MSNSIFDEKNNMIDKPGEGSAHEEGQESLKGYVKRLLKQKKMTLREVQRRSGGQITQAYVGAIVKGVHSNPTVEKLKALARGLGVDEDELFRAARGLPNCEPSQSWAYDSKQTFAFLELMQRIVMNANLLSILEELADLPPDAQMTALKAIKALSEAKRENRPRSKTG